MVYIPKATQKIRVFQSKIIKWYDTHGDKHLPWRNTNNPWHVLIAGLLLKKTTTKQVLQIYSKFIDKYPNPKAILESSKDEIRNLIKPLGLEHRRTELIMRLSLIILDEFEGKIPSTRKELKKLPGIGDYIASEVLLIAYNKPKPLLDRNMIRVLERIFSLKTTKKRAHTDPKLWAFAEKLIPTDPEKAKAFNYGVLDFARKICTARNPKCTSCPIRNICNTYRSSS